MVNSKLVVEKKRVLLDWRENGKRRRRKLKVLKGGIRSVKFG